MTDGQGSISIQSVRLLIRVFSVPEDVGRSMDVLDGHECAIIRHHLVQVLPTLQ